jgi:hypothetical protein
MGLDTSTRIFSFQIMDQANISGGGITLSGTDAREIIEDFLYNALTSGQNIDITYNDVPTPGVITIATTDNITVPGALAAGSTTITPTTSGVDVINFTEGEGGIICNDFTISGTEFKLYSADANPVFLFYTTSGTIGVEADQDLIGLKDSEIHLRGQVSVYGNLLATSSGVYSIGAAGLPFNSGYFDDLYVKGSSIHLGESVELTEYNGTDLQIGSDIRLTATNPVMEWVTGNFSIKIPSDNKGTQVFNITNASDTPIFQVTEAGNTVLYAGSNIGWSAAKLSQSTAAGGIPANALQINSDIYLSKGSTTIYNTETSDPIVFDLYYGTFELIGGGPTPATIFSIDSSDGNIETYSWIDLNNASGNTGLRAGSNKDINLVMSGNDGTYKTIFRDGTLPYDELASVDSLGNIDTTTNITASGTIGFSTAQISEYNGVDLSINSDVRFSVANPVLYGVTGNFNIKIPSEAKGTQYFNVLNHLDATIFAVNENGQILQYGDVILFQYSGDSGFNIEGSNDIFFNLGTTDGTTKIKFRDNNAEDQAWIDSDGNAWFADIAPTASGTYDLGSKAAPYQAFYLEDQVTGAPYKITIESGVVTATAV